MPTRALLLVDHGSRVAASNAQLVEVARLVEAELGDGTPVAHAHMELASPSIAEAVSTLAARGVEEVVVVPYFLGPGRHATADVPRLAHEASEAHPGLRVRVAPPLGVHRLLAQLVLVRSEE
jgi:sirohydrochlorin ferrochelatase